LTVCLATSPYRPGTCAQQQLPWHI